MLSLAPFSLDVGFTPGSLSPFSSAPRPHAINHYTALHTPHAGCSLPPVPAQDYGTTSEVASDSRVTHPALLCVLGQVTQPLGALMTGVSLAELTEEAVRLVQA